MKSICGKNCCDECPQRENVCGGCISCDGHPCGGYCFIAEKVKKDGMEGVDKLKQQLIEELNGLGYNLNLKDLNELCGGFVNLEYPVPSGMIKFLNDKDVYYGNQIEIDGEEKCYGVIANEEFLLVCRYGYMGAEPELLTYKKRL